MATTCLTPCPCSSSSLASKTISRTRVIQPFLSSSIRFRYPKLSCSLVPLFIPISHFSQPFASSSYLFCHTTHKTSLITVSALVEEEPLAETLPEDEEANADDLAPKNLIRPCELYVCNLPRSCDISELLHIFKPYGTVQSVEVSRNAETGISRGCGYVTMSSMDEAKTAISALDGSDVGGREMRVRFSVDVNSTTRKLEALNSTPKKNLIFESPYKIYVGNLAWSVKPEDLRNHFSQFGTVVSARVLYDRKGGKSRVYGFLSFSSDAESEAAMSLNGTDFHGRTLLVREIFNRTES
ncbi:28 kDa ribonucleoprotein, chloroplastic [Cornus florida]|uniref:28 kDa ribonucleoprotein, chloroplastic n=1 Tax=Cornus florida TaxID=4283 RepID=UPI00289ECB68|nr:28 kDa ribonucleoprotein, chloroplastic [Cornus florida]